jgi:translation initiation factor IF-3
MIRAREVMVVDPAGKNLGVMPTKEAIELAEDHDLDLVEVAPNGVPPVCKIMDYGKYKYKQSKRDHEAKKKQKIIRVKEIKITPKTDEHDYQVKLKHVFRFLNEGDKAKITVVFRGRQIVHTEFGRDLLDRFVEDTREVAQIEMEPRQEGRNMVLVLSPRKNVRTPTSTPNPTVSDAQN